MYAIRSYYAVGREKNDNPSQHPLVNAIQGGDHLEATNLLPVPANLVHQGVGLGNVAEAWRYPLGPGDLTIHGYRGINDILPFDNPLKLQRDLEIVKDPDTLFKRAQAGFPDSLKKSINVSNISYNFV